MLLIRASGGGGGLHPPGQGVGGGGSANHDMFLQPDILESYKNRVAAIFKMN